MGNKEKNSEDFKSRGKEKEKEIIDNNRNNIINNNDNNSDKNKNIVKNNYDNGLEVEIISEEKEELVKDFEAQFLKFLWFFVIATFIYFLFNDTINNLL